MQQINRTLEEMGVRAPPAKELRIVRSATRIIAKTAGESKSARRIARRAAMRERRQMCVAEE